MAFLSSPVQSQQREFTVPQTEMRLTRNPYDVTPAIDRWRSESGWDRYLGEGSQSNRPTMLFPGFYSGVSESGKLDPRFSVGGFSDPNALQTLIGRIGNQQDFSGIKKSALDDYNTARTANMATTEANLMAQGRGVRGGDISNLQSQGQRGGLLGQQAISEDFNRQQAIGDIDREGRNLSLLGQLPNLTVQADRARELNADRTLKELGAMANYNLDSYNAILKELQGQDAKRSI